MDIFGKSAGAKPKTHFQNELAAKMKERKAKGLSADLTETEDEEDDGALASDDDLLAAFSMTSKKQQQPRSQSPWRAEAEGRVTPKAEPPKPQARTGLGAKEAKPRQKIPIKPKNELDRLLADDDENGEGLLQTQKKPWQPPQFKDFSMSEESSRQAAPQPKGRTSKQSPLVKPRQQSALVEEDEGGSDDEELTSAYTRQLQQRGSPQFGKQSPVEKRNQFSPKDRQSPAGKGPASRSPLLQDKPIYSGKTTPKTTEDELFGRKSTKQASNLDDTFGRRKSPSDQDLFSGRKTPKSQDSDGLSGPKSQYNMKAGRKTPQDELSGRKSPKTPQDERFGRTSHKTPQDELHGKKSPKTPQDELYGRKSSKTPQDDLYGRKSPQTPKSELFGGKNARQGSMLDDVFGAKKRAESPLFKSKQDADDSYNRAVQRESLSRGEETEQRRPQAQMRKGSYMASLLADSDEEKEDKSQKVNTRTSYMDSLLGDGNKDQQPKASTRTAYMDNLLNDDDEDGGRKPRPRQRPSVKENSEQERESSVSRDVDKDPLMIEKMKSDREAKKQSQKGKSHTESQQVEFDIEEVADAQNSLSMTYIQTEKSAPSNRHTPVSKPKPRKPNGSSPTAPDSSTVSFESASDIRNYIYKEWREKKQAAAKESVKEKRQKEKEEQIKKDKEALDQRLENEATFRTWKEQKDEKLKDKLRKMRQEEKKSSDEELKKHEKKRDSEMIFRKWKESKDEQIIENRRKVKRGEMAQLTSKHEDETRKKKDAEGAFAGWKVKKDREIKKNLLRTKVVEKQEVTQKMSDTRRREIEAEELYEKWLQKKEEQKKREKLQARSRRSLQESPRPAWSPANKTIPCGR